MGGLMYISKLGLLSKDGIIFVWQYAVKGRLYGLLVHDIDVMYLFRVTFYYSIHLKGICEVTFLLPDHIWD